VWVASAHGGSLFQPPIRFSRRHNFEDDWKEEDRKLFDVASFESETKRRPDVKLFETWAHLLIGDVSQLPVAALTSMKCGSDRPSKIDRWHVDYQMRLLNDRASSLMSSRSFYAG
jgi:hypothetical protein